ncbi:anthranilate synthase component I family protein [Rhodocytophaga rosea]|uniref:Anthranilate synthase component I family protein n=1 Tax=Rhodocytophaga rosea TaxID=2704465 RepID=A0A6C0GR80_9BACT|nr:anthranilate synthase component I family protein [Rhodocytophaga rosea]QHT70113.1 anthranilate synthase component I family protein [Rhodocytophaga rosea]
MHARKKGRFLTDNIEDFKRSTFSWAQHFQHIHYFNNNQYSFPFGAFPNMLAIGSARQCHFSGQQTFETLQQFHQQHQDWLVGYFSYDLKNEIEALSSLHPDYLSFPLAYFYIPQHIIRFAEDHIWIESLEEPADIYKQILSYSDTSISTPVIEVPIQQRTSKELYIQHVNELKNHILEGDVYEINYCMEFFAQDAALQPWQTYLALNQKSPMPFSVFQRIGNQYILCASPERFLKKQGSRLLSQPIKGTAGRGKTPAEDEHIKLQLRHNEKEMAENMMIVDLVRNDLARSALTGSVTVEEMFGIYTFPQLHQMISTVSATLKPETPFTKAIRNAFPMGSMTGAPKIKAMELIEQYEQARRGLYSGAIGFITPEGDFDFNVVIRSILYNAQNKYLSFQVGSAITYDAVAEQEYDECLLKAKAILEVLQ